ncbi:hypothetical protein EZV62_026767 [Acer yangbiense]|uniref:GB1/RHD3-type G domain-containing protein n=1 Tax=Acer yangbiense TaxID=1000413 RepID=A0A5C7GS61_9ROSI|nr:hypothetical protein EZV62_026767 [Acer yangbiense]
MAPSEIDEEADHGEANSEAMLTVSSNELEALEHLRKALSVGALDELVPSTCDNYNDDNGSIFQVSSPCTSAPTSPYSPQKGRDSPPEKSVQYGYSPSPSPSRSPSISAPITGPARPIRFVYRDDKGKFRMDPAAIAALQLVKEPIGVVSVCGRARQGKSFILNQLLGRSSGFQVASTHRPCTKGLWLWSAPLKRTALDGTEYNLLLLDSEGIAAYDQTGVEEAECQKAYNSATDTYMSNFDRPKLPEEVALREAHGEAAQKSLAVYNAGAVGVGAARKKYEGLLMKFFKKAFEDDKRNIFMEAEIQCSKAIHSMEKRLRAACHSFDANIDNVVKVLDSLITEYEASCHGPGKWQKLAMFLQRSLEGPVFDLAKRLIDQIGSEKSSLVLKCRSVDDKMKLLNKQLEDSEKYKSEYLKRYDDAINDKKKLGNDYTSRITNLQGENSSLKEKYSNLSKSLDYLKHETSDWKRKYEQVLTKQKDKEDQVSSEIEVLKSRSTTAEARLAAAREQAMSAQEEVEEWKKKYGVAVREAKAALEKAAIVQERTNKEMQLREDALRHFIFMNMQEEEVKDKAAKIVHAEQCLTTLRLELKVQSLERETRMMEQEKLHLEEKYRSEFERFDEVHERCKIAEREAKRSNEVAEKERAEATAASRAKSDFEKLAMERLAVIERVQRQNESLEREKTDYANEVNRLWRSEMEARSKVALLEARVEEREKEIESLLDSNNVQRASTVKKLEDLLESERKARATANAMAESLSHEVQSAQAKHDELQQELTKARLSETALDSKLKAASHGKRVRVDDYEMGVGSVQEMNTDDKNLRANKRSRSTTSPIMYTQPEDGGSVFKGDKDNLSQQSNHEDYTRFTVQKLKQELTKHNFGAELLQLRNPNKKEILALYEKYILQKSASIF